MCVCVAGGGGGGGVGEPKGMLYFLYSCLNHAKACLTTGPLLVLFSLSHFLPSIYV